MVACPPHPRPPSTLPHEEQRVVDSSRGISWAGERQHLRPRRTRGAAARPQNMETRGGGRRTWDIAGSGCSHRSSAGPDTTPTPEMGSVEGGSDEKRPGVTTLSLSTPHPLLKRFQPDAPTGTKGLNNLPSTHPDPEFADTTRKGEGETDWRRDVAKKPRTPSPPEGAAANARRRGRPVVNMAARARPRPSARAWPPTRIPGLSYSPCPAFPSLPRRLQHSLTAGIRQRGLAAPIVPASTEGCVTLSAPVGGSGKSFISPFKICIFNKKRTPPAPRREPAGLTLT